MSVAILLSTFNGGEYIRDLILSLEAQTYNDFLLYIRDDGSSDSTLRKLGEFSITYRNVIIMHDNIKHRMAANSFMWMLENVSADYYMFCDQDDIWLPNKIEVFLNEMYKIEDSDTPSLVISDLSVVDDGLNKIDHSFWHYQHLIPELLVQRRYAITANVFTGCALMLNEAAKRVALPFNHFATMHDAWIGLRVIYSNGKIGIIHSPLVLYRQHGDNVCGAVLVRRGVCYYLRKLKDLVKIFKCYINYYRMSNVAFCGKVNFLEFMYWKILYLLKR